MTDPVTARPTGAVSRTYIDENLRKIGKAKTLGSPAGVVRLSRDEDVLQGLHLAEGLETALSAVAKGLRPVWSTGSTALMKTFPVLDGIDCLTVIADHDATGVGENAAREVETRWRRAGREAHVFMPASRGDFNDLLQQARA
jgi:putative DNA primase/helicase